MGASSGDSEYQGKRNIEPDLESLIMTQERRDKINANARARYARDRDRIRAYQKAWAAANPDKVANWKRDPDVRKRAARKWAALHPELKQRRQRAWRLDPKNRESQRACARSWYHRNRDKAYEMMHRRRQRLQEGAVSCAQKIKSLLQEAFCYWCSNELLSGNRHIDHVHPLSRGGRHEPGNIVASCAKCNCEKADRLYWEWDGELAS